MDGFPNGFDEAIERRRLQCVDDIDDGPAPRCVRCNSADNMDVGGPDFCRPCREDIWDHAQSYGSGASLRILERMNSFRLRRAA